MLGGLLMAAGCSYTPARLYTGPLIEVGDPSHRHHRHRHHDHDRWWHDHRRGERRWDRRRGERRRHHHDRHHRSRFCPPGLAMQGRC
ncbi:hypothetical protein [Halomonas koreensis]|uniref:Lipoprotein n=1 Tax=Halomonas koreensis TaxID=245385 RepID=A0ABU1FZK7_9GAMM|nr:hypothetical protein [Halomonas koreensis]MDR5866111.1 hypothetical protein [Halomonas koreensis]